MTHFVLAAIMVLMTLHWSQLVTRLSPLRDCELLEDKATADIGTLNPELSPENPLELEPNCGAAGEG